MLCFGEAEPPVMEVVGVLHEPHDPILAHANIECYGFLASEKSWMVLNSATLRLGFSASDLDL